MLKKLAMISVLALVAAACGGRSGGDTAAETTTTTAAITTTTAATPTTTTASATTTTAATPTTTTATTATAAETTTTMQEHGADGEHEADRQIEVVMSEFAFSPDPIEVAAGETVEFVLINEGVIEHEFRLTTEHAAEEHVASGHAGHDDGAEADHAHGEVIVLVPAGETDHVTVTFDENADFDVVACLIPAHFEAGMHVPLVVSG